MKKNLIIYLSIIFICLFLNLSYGRSSKFKKINIDLTGNYTAQLTESKLNIYGGEFSFTYRFIKQLGAEGYFSYDFYNITYHDGTYDYMNLNYGLGIRWYLANILYVRILFGNNYQNYSISSLSDDNNQWRFGSGIGLLLPYLPWLSINLGGDYYRYFEDETNHISAHAGITISI